MVAMTNSASSTASNSTRFAESATPPSERDLQVYEAVAALGLSSRGAANAFQISQTRVLQIRQRVEEWIGRYAPRSVDSLTPRQRLIVAADLADRRSQMLFSEAMEAWRESQDAARERCTAGARPTGSLQGDPRYLAMAMRTNMHMLQVAGLTQRLMAKLAKEAAEAPAAGSPAAGAVPAEIAADEFNAGVHPLIRDCSPAATEQTEPAEEPPAVDFVSGDENATYDDQEARRRAFLAAVEAENAPVQPPRTDAQGMLLEEGFEEPWRLESATEPESEPMNACETSETAVATLATPRRPLTRQERKARQRLLQRKLRKGK